MPFELSLIAVVVTALAMGGFLKGATGAGAPVVAVPVIAAFFDVRLGILVMLVPNIVLNILQVYRHGSGWRDLRPGRLMAVGAIPGVFLGTLLLTRLSDEALALGLAVFLTLYILHRLRSPSFALSDARFYRLTVPVGVIAGFMQGAAGMSGPVALALLNATKLDRDQFIANISLFFLVTSAVQTVPLFTGGLLTWHNFLLSTAAVVPILAMMPVGNFVGKRLDKARFGQLVLILIAILTLRLYWRAFF